jgi:2'-5' RNA ligase
MPRIGVFEQTSVIFCEIGAGREELIELHDAMNVGGLAYDEPFEYHPHVTLAQGIDRQELPAMYEMAVRRWRESAPSTRVLIETITFVQNTANNVWIDLDECELRGLATMPVR